MRADDIKMMDLVAVRILVTEDSGCWVRFQLERSHFLPAVAWSGKANLHGAFMDGPLIVKARDVCYRVVQGVPSDATGSDGRLWSMYVSCTVE